MGSWRLEDNYSAGARLPESPRVPMEFLSRSWSASALEVSKALAPYISSMFPKPATIATAAAAASSAPIPEHFSGESEEHQSTLLSTNPLYSFASSATSQRVLDRIMSQSSQDVSPLTSGRPSLSSEPLNAGESCGGSLTATDSPPISPSQDFYDVVKFLRLNNPQQPQITGNRSAANPGGGGKTVGRWLKDRKEKKKEETRTQNAQLHAAVSVAGVAAAIAATTAATAASSRSGKDEKMAKTDKAVASAATLVAAQYVEAAEALGAERNHLASVISSAVNVRSYDDILTLTAAAATALRGAATLKARALKEGWTNCAVTPAAAERSTGPTNSSSDSHHSSNDSYGGEEVGFDQEFLSRGCELLKRTRKGDLHWKIVSVYIHRSGQVMLKMKSKHVAGTITKKKKNVVFEVYKDLPVWPGRLLLEDGEQHSYFGLKTEMRGIVEFECKNQKEHDKWTRGISTLLSIVAEKKYRFQT